MIKAITRIGLLFNLWIINLSLLNALKSDSIIIHLVLSYYMNMFQGGYYNCLEKNGFWRSLCM